MTNNLPKQIAFKTLIKHKCYSLNSYIDLKHIIESKQFTIIEYKKYANSELVSELIKRLQIESETQQSDSFLYIKNNLKFVFINADISVEDKCSILRHELGHICDPDLKNNCALYSEIQKEEFANQFSCYAKKPGIPFIIYLYLIKKWKLLVALIALIACVLGISVIINTLTVPSANPATDDATTFTISDGTYYVTSAGKKYHRKGCIIVKYKNNLTEIKLQDATNDGYKPCKICNPQEE